MSYFISGHLMVAIANMDHTGLDDAEESLLMDFMDNEIGDNFGFDVIEEAGDNFHICDITGKFADCAEVVWYNG